MIHFSGYQIKEKIFDRYNCAIFRGTQYSGNKPVILKILNTEYALEREIAHLIWEYEIANKLVGDGIIRVYSLEKNNNSMAIVMEDFGGDSIAKALQSRQPSLLEKLSLAVKMTNSLIQIHQQNIIHKDINPSNFIWNPDTDQVKLIDFGISTELSREVAQFLNPNVLEGTLNYVSPEQTGRMNRPMDYRTDLYSLGATLYEIFTEQLPFKGDDEIEVIYGHLAKTCPSPKDMHPDIPEAISDIVMKLLSKAAEHRYQTAAGLKKDLEFCLSALKSKGEIEGFILGQNDITAIFQIPQKLYGREEEIAVLMDAFEDISENHAKLLLVSGHPGVGKSSLIHEIHKPIVSRKGYFISGKFDQIERNIPYTAIIQAFQGLMRTLLTESKEALERWKQILLHALSPNAQVIIDLIPELEQIIGHQPSVIELNPREAQNRFQITFREFIKGFAHKEHPMVIFLDDLQWSDIATLDLLKSLLGTSEVQHVLFIGSYRDNEVNAGHPLLTMLEEMNGNAQSSILPLHQLFLKPLNKSVINQLIADTFHCPPDTSKPLSDLIFSKTKGNPFFINQMLYSFHQKGTFTFLIDEARWDWDLQEIENVEMSDNVIDLLVESLELLPSGTLEILKIASCIGNQFDFRTLSLICEQSTSELGRNLWVAVEKEIIRPLDHNYRIIRMHKKIDTRVEARFSFRHDRIQQAVYSLILKSEKPVVHLKIGRQLIKSFGKTERTEYIFDLVNQINLGRELIHQKEERIELANFNLLAGTKAKKATAFTTASQYFEIAISLLSEEEWAFMPDKLFELSLAHAEAIFLSGDINKADRLCQHLSGLATHNFDKGSVSNLNVRILEFQAKLPEAINEIRRSLQLFNVSLPEDPHEIKGLIEQGLGKMQNALAQTRIEELVNLPEMKDPEKIMAMQLLFQVIPPALQSNPPLYILATLMMFDLTISYGTTVFSCKNFVDCGVIQGLLIGDYKSGYQLGEAAFALLKKYEADALKPSVYFVFTFLSHWRVHYKESLDYYDMSYRTGMETGDMQHAAYARAHKAHLQMYVGTNLTACKQETENTIIFLKESNGAVQLLLAQIVLHAIKKFQTLPDQTEEIDTEESDNLLMAAIEKIQNVTFLCRFGQYNCFVYYIMGNMEAAEKWNQFAEKIIYAGASDFPTPDHYLFQSLLLIHKWKNATVEEKQDIMETLRINLNKMKNWSDNCPSNFAHKYYLLSAEMAIIQDQSLETITELYQKAIDAIGTDDFIQMRALTLELQGNFWLKRGNETIGRSFIKEAYRAYEHWGAFRKLSLLEQTYANYCIPTNNSYEKTKASDSGSPDSHSITSNSLDLVSIIKSTQAISSEIKIEKLLRVLMRTMIENAGAQHGSLLLKRESDSELYIEAVKQSNSEKIWVMQSIPFKEHRDICPEIIQYVARTKKNIVMNNACNEGDFQDNPYIVEHQIKSVLCMPVIYQNTLKGVVYLENNLSDNVFTPARLEVLKILSSQASVSIDNARLYENLEEKVRERTIQLTDANEKLKQLSLLDPLTNLHNRRYLYEYISQYSTSFINNKIRALEDSDKRGLSLENKVLGVILIDIDHFKEVNDTYGHLAGDKVLVIISNTLKNMIRADDFIVRWGGEEFLIILNNTNPDYLETFSKRVLATIKETPLKLVENKIIYKTCSIGYAKIPFDRRLPKSFSLEQTINLSDYALYFAKENGRNRAACIHLKRQGRIDDDIRDYLIHLSKDTEINSDYIEMEYITTSPREYVMQ